MVMTIVLLNLTLMMIHKMKFMILNMLFHQIVLECYQSQEKNLINLKALNRSTCSNIQTGELIIVYLQITNLEFLVQVKMKMEYLEYQRRFKMNKKMKIIFMMILKTIIHLKSITSVKQRDISIQLKREVQKVSS